MDDSYHQTFRTKSSSEVVTIPTRLDSKSGQRVVRWKDIQQHFENAKTILNGKCSVLFLTDDNLEDLIPLRIAHHPGVVLEVVVTDNTTRGYPGPPEILELTSSGLGSHIQHLEHLISLCASLRDSYARQSVVTLPQYTTTSTNQHNHYDPPRLLCDVEGNMDQQDQLRQLKQQTQQMQRQIEEIFQKTASTQEQMVEILQTTASMQQQVVEIVQKAETSEHQNRQELQLLREWTEQADRGNPLTLDQIRGQFSRRQLEILNRHIVMHDRIQALLRDFTKELSAPRFFFILPKDIDQDYTEDASASLFRLHFLCECGSHTMSKDSKDPHEVHMTDHPGYDLKRPKEFFDKYGAYVLTMMYMIKYGAMADGYVVPPLLQSKHAGITEQNQEQHCLTKETIARLVDDTITHLEEVGHAADSDTNIQRWRVLGDMKSYLEVNEDDHFPGAMHQLTRLGQHCSWVCREHRYGWNLLHLKDIVNIIGGTHVENPGNIEIKVNSSSVTKQLYDVVTEICTIQCTKDKIPLNIDCGRLSWKTDGSRNVQDVVMTIKRLADLTTDDIEFTRQCNLIKLSVEYTPATTDEDRLVNILQQSLNLKELRIGCRGERSHAVINLIVSTREKALQDGKSTALHTFELMEEELKPFNLHRPWDGHDYISATLTFSEGSTKLEVDTHLVLQNSKGVVEGDWICKFLRQYGWSISCLNTAARFNDHLASLMDDSTQIHGSRLTHLFLLPYRLTSVGMDSMDRVVKRSRSLTYFKASFVGLQGETESEKVAPFLERFKARLNTLEFTGDNVERWLPEILKNFPPRSSLPILDYLILGTYKKHAFPHECIPWLVSMVSDPLQPSGPSMIGEDCTGTPQHTATPYMVPTRLKRFFLSKFTLTLEDWATLIKAIDLSVMLELRFCGANFSQGQLDLLLDRITSTGEQSVSLKDLDLGNTGLVGDADKNALRERVHKVAPRVKILGL
ncbi:hypothetical protein B0O80DRAFT_275402 [Mortierella sp. GBAus27b]|nr:hypothetical protein B0O80DRAFT_275402 [Mortierella sp. GBAus27b]